MKFRIDKANFKSTLDLLLNTCWLSQQELETALDEERTEIITGHTW